ncbi:MAG: methyltransferase domain-containing protein [Elusimicrobia bacterium]|nr:methyltransferase domain-containing protein [Elusimicrobiota bacterium]
MCNEACLDFIRNVTNKEELEGKQVLEIGSLDVNGSARSFIEKMGPSKYLGIDIVNGNGVDEICSIYDILEKYGNESFDVVVCTEVMEHVKDWKKAISNMKKIIRRGGIILLTTRSSGYKYHAWPYDFWRFEADDMKNIFSDFSILRIEKGLDSPGVFVKAKKPGNFVENNISHYKLYSIVADKNVSTISSVDYLINFHRLFLLFAKDKLRPLLPQAFKNIVKKILGK